MTPLYEELGPEPKEGEPNYKTNLRTLSKTFLCRAGYKPCIEEAQAAYKRWIDSDNPDDGNPYVSFFYHFKYSTSHLMKCRTFSVAYNYICPVYKWGTMKEWEFGLQRVINFPTSRKQSERTFILKALAGCPMQQEKTERLLNITLLEDNGDFTENDIFLIFSMFSGGSNGYGTLIKFLEKNWNNLQNRCVLNFFIRLID